MKSLVAVALVLLFAIQSRSANVEVFSQTPANTSALIPSSWLASTGSDADMYAYDDFTLTADAPVTEIHWRGGYIYGAPFGRVTGFSISIFESIAGGYQPHVGHPEFTEPYLANYLLTGNAGEMSIGMVGDKELFDYSYQLPTPFQAKAGVKYWLRIEATQRGYPDWGIATGSGGNGVHFAFSTGAARFFYGTGDAAFTLLAPPGPYLNISATATPDLGGSVSGSGLFTNGANVTLVATASPGYAFVDWTENGNSVSTAASYTFPATRSRSLAAQFAPALSVITSASPPSGGTTTGDGNYVYGSKLTVSSIPSGSGYSFVNWTENGVPVSVAADYTFTIGNNRDLVANFVPAATSQSTAYSQPADPSNGGIIKSSWYYPDGLDGDEYAYDSFQLSTNASITAIQWRGGYNNYKQGAGKSPVSDFTISIYPSIAAGIQPDILTQPLAQYTVGSNAGESLAGTFGGTEMYDYNFTLPKPFTAIAGTKYWLQIEAAQGVTPFYGWPPDWGLAYATGGNGSHFRKIVGGTAGGGDAYFSSSGDTAFTLFTAQSQHSITLIASPADGGMLAGGGQFNDGTPVTATAAPAPGYVFVNWNENGAPVNSSTNYKFTVSGNRTLVAQFAQQCVISSSAAPTNGGTVSGSGTFLSGSDVALVAHPNPGFAFVNWTEDGFEVSTEPNYFFVADASHNLVANFAPLFTVSATISPSGSGTVSGTGTFPAGANVTLIPSPKPACAFVGWQQNGALVCNSPVYSFTVDTNISLTAVFSTAVSITTTASTTNGLVSGDGVYPTGEIVQVSAVPFTGFACSNWMENGISVSTLPNYAFPTDTNRVLTASFVPDITSITFDFDKATPKLQEGNSTPLTQTSGVLTAVFTSGGTPSFSVQSDGVTGLQLSKFTGKYLYPAGNDGVLEIKFSQPVIRASVGFATFDFQTIVAPSIITASAYQISTNNQPVASTNATGYFNGIDSMPMGTLDLTSPEPFDLIRIELPGGGFAIDNINVTILPKLSIAQPTAENILLMWEAPAPFFTLQQSTDLSIWQDVTNEVSVSSGTNQIVVAPQPQRMFFKLKR